MTILSAVIYEISKQGLVADIGFTIVSTIWFCISLAAAYNEYNKNKEETSK